VHTKEVSGDGLKGGEGRTGSNASRLLPVTLKAHSCRATLASAATSESRSSISTEDRISVGTYEAKKLSRSTNGALESCWMANAANCIADNKRSARGGDGAAGRGASTAGDGASAGGTSLRSVCRQTAAAAVRRGCMWVRSAARRAGSACTDTGLKRS
jgi:hypothetical protein